MLHLELPVRREAVTAARRAVEDAFGDDLPDDAHDDLRLLVSEVVANSVRHAELPDAERIGLTVEVGPTAVRAEVTDAGPGFEPTPRPSIETASGWGLELVEQLADRWGVERENATRVWFEIDHR